MEVLTRYIPKPLILGAVGDKPLSGAAREPAVGLYPTFAT